MLVESPRVTPPKIDFTPEPREGDVVSPHADLVAKALGQIVDPLGPTDVRIRQAFSPKGHLVVRESLGFATETDAANYYDRQKQILTALHLADADGLTRPDTIPNLTVGFKPVQWAERKTGLLIRPDGTARVIADPVAAELYEGGIDLSAIDPANEEQMSAFMSEMEAFASNSKVVPTILEPTPPSGRVVVPDTVKVIDERGIPRDVLVQRLVDLTAVPEKKIGSNRNTPQPVAEVQYVTGDPQEVEPPVRVQARIQQLPSTARRKRVAPPSANIREVPGREARVNVNGQTILPFVNLTGGRAAQEANMSKPLSPTDDMTDEEFAQGAEEAYNEYLRRQATAEKLVAARTPLKLVSFTETDREEIVQPAPTKPEISANALFGGGSFELGSPDPLDEEEAKVVADLRAMLLEQTSRKEPAATAGSEPLPQRVVQEQADEPGTNGTTDYLDARANQGDEARRAAIQRLQSIQLPKRSDE